MDRTVLITGGTGALGEAVTRRFLESGAKVAVTWIMEKERERLLADLPADNPPFMVQADVTDQASVDRAIQEVRSNLGPIDVLVHLVGAWKGGVPVQDQDAALWDSMLKLNLTSAFLCAHAVLPDMYERDWGRVVVVSSRNARIGRKGQSAYSIAKAGVAVLAEAIAEEARGTGVTANVVAPSTLDTPANRRAMPEADHSSWVPLTAVANTIYFLASEAAGQLRGAWMPVYGSA